MLLSIFVIFQQQAASSSKIPPINPAGCRVARYALEKARTCLRASGLSRSCMTRPLITSPCDRAFSRALRVPGFQAQFVDAVETICTACNGAGVTELREWYERQFHWITAIWDGKLLTDYADPVQQAGPRLAHCGLRKWYHRNGHGKLRVGGPASVSHRWCELVLSCNKKA